VGGNLYVCASAERETTGVAGNPLRFKGVASKYRQATFRHVRQLSGNGREDGQKGKYRREKYWDSKIVIDNQQKSGVREQSLKKRGHDFAARRAK
jgi:hypothetical protein